MPTVLYLRGAPGTGKRTVADILERDLCWPVLWVHLLDPVYKAIGSYKVPDLTDKLIRATASHLMSQKRDFIVVRPSRQTWGMEGVASDANSYGHSFVGVKLTASYKTLVTRVTRRCHVSPFRLTTQEALDEYLNSRPESAFPGEHVVDTESLTPEQVAGRVKELLP
jgi:hypothetical protein